MQRPNIVLFITDQHRADWLGCNGHPVVRTPAIDRLAAEGVTFDRFYVASPVCMPNRSSLMTGRMPSVHGVRANGTPLSQSAVTFADLLRDAGYETALIGKSHLQTFTGAPALLSPPPPKPGYHGATGELAQALRHGLASPGYEQESPAFWSRPDASLSLPYYGFEHVELVTGHGDGVGGDYRRWLLEREPRALDMIGAQNQLAHDYACPQAVRTRLPAELYQTSYIAERARAFVAERAGRGDGARPFFLMVSFPDPHHPFNPPGKYWDMYRPDQFAAPEAFARNDWTPPPHVAAVLAEREAGAANLNSQFSFAVTVREAQEAAALTAGMITMIDDAVGSVVSVVESNGLMPSTALAFTSDHGEHLGDHRLLLKGSEQYQQILRVPFVWSDPDARNGSGRLAAAKGCRSAAISSTIDIPATILDRASVAPYVGMQGRSLVPVLAGEDSNGRRAAFIQYDHQRSNSALGGVPRIHTLVDRRWRLSMFDGVEWGELYDLASDPGEFVNLWDDPASAEVKARMIEQLAREEIAHIDRVPMPTGRA
ncbi:MAG: sulfatase [Hyphomicrobiaceae bacterium]